MSSLIKYCALLALSLVCLVVSSCDNNACKESMYTPMNVQFFHKDAAKSPYVMSAVSVFSVRAGQLVDTDIKDSSFAFAYNLMLDPASSTSKFLLISNEFRDTMVVRHSNTNEFVSAECGARVVSHIDTFYLAGGSFFDSIVVANPVVNGVFNAQNVKIYME